MFGIQLPTLPALIQIGRTYAIHFAALGLIAILGWVVGLNSGSQSSTDTRGADAFAPPAWQRFQAGPSRARATEVANFVTDPSEQVAPKVEEKVEAEKGPDDAWRFIGTAVNGNETVAFIVVGKPAKLLTVAGKDKLPNGEEVVAIEVDRLKYSRDGQDLEVKLFERKKK